LLTSQVGPGNLPRLQTEWVGDLANLQRRVANLAQASVVTLTGSGGVGKTRAAIEIGWLVADEFVDGVWMVELAPIADPDLVVTTIASALGASLQPGSTMIESIVDWCLGRRMLLIIDNCEHVLDPVIGLVRAIVADCPTVTIIATSREPIGVAGETVARIASLDERDASELFVLRARSADAGFEPTDADRNTIAGICGRLDGIPLAIELAAARIRSLGPSELLNRLDDRFRLLRGGGRGGLERHQTLRATVAWSYQLLAEDARVLFDRLSVFAGSFDLDAAEAICAGDHFDDDQLAVDDIVDVLGDLVDKSMVNAVRSGRGMRYRLLETLRQYGEERLDDRGETAVVRDTHLGHFVTVARRLGQRSDSADQADAYDRLEDDWENLGAAHGWAITTGDIAQAHVLFGTTGSFAVGQVRRDHQQWGARTLELANTTGQHDAMTYFMQGIWAYSDGDADQAVALGELAAAMGTPGAATLGRTVSLFGHMAAGRTDTAMQIASELRSALPTINDPGERYWATLAILNAYGLDTLASDIDAALAAARTIGSPSAIALVLRNAAGRCFSTDPPDFDRGFADLNEAIRLTESVKGSLQWEWMFLALGKTLADDPAALDTLQQAVHFLHDQRQWAALDATLEAAPALLARHDPVAAATLYGYLEQSPPPVGQLGVGVRALATELVNAIADNETHRARGAAMDRHDIVALTLATLTDN
jgi:predicted ATPase